VQDAASGGLNLTTTYQADALGRRTQMLGPVHAISLDGISTPIQRARWTQYLDAIEQVRTINGYVVVSTGAPAVINPVMISVTYSNDPEVAGGRMEQDIAAVWYGFGLPDPGYNFAQADFVAWSTQSINSQNQVTNSRVYYQVPASGLGEAGTNYAQTNFGYDSAGRQNQVTSPTGTITLNTFNTMSWLTETSVGTTLTNLASIITYVYNGNGSVVEASLSDGIGVSFNKVYFYDWRERRITTLAEGSPILITELTYDNRDNVIEVQNSRINPALHLNQVETSFDALNRVYQTQRFGVDITTGGGTLGPALTANIYYDPAGRLVRNEPAGVVGFTAAAYDAIGRPVAQYQAYNGTLEPADPGDISDSTVVEQSETTYDDASNVISALNRQRFDDATGTGALQNPTVQPEARVYYIANYPDALGRVVATANFGTNGGATWTRPETIPPNSGTVLVTSFIYDNAGRKAQVTDPMGITTQTLFDQAGRRITLIENYQPGSGSGLNVNKTTEFTYNDDGNLITLTALNATTGNQVTQWIYGVTPATGSLLYSNALPYQKIYPDGSAPSDLVKYSYDVQGRLIQMVDQAGTTHDYTYDQYGRLTNDAVTAFGTGVDTTVQSIQRAYDPRGMLNKITSYGADSVLLNQVLLVYNSFSQLAQDYQEHNGAVNTSTTLQVSYSYADGTANTVRQTGITYPDGTQIGFTYTSTTADSISRPDGLTDNGNPLCSYAYLGLGVFVNVTYNAASNLEWTAETGGTGDAGDQYTALDRFGRLVETLWQTGSATQVHSKYGRNQIGGIVWRQDLAAAAAGVTTQDNYYWYDGLQQVQEHQSGQLNGTAPNYTGIVAPPQQDETFGYDATGNWATYNILDPANAQTRAHNAANEITAITNSTVTTEPAVQYDPAGNMTLTPQPGNLGENYELVYDAWNRLVQVIALSEPPESLSTAELKALRDAADELSDASSSSSEPSSVTVALYVYDGLTRRITKTAGSSVNNYYYSKDWQVIGVLPNGFNHYRFIWGLRDINDLIVREDVLSLSVQQHFALRDQWNVVAITDQTAAVEERYAYDAFGTTLFMTPAFAAESDSLFDWETTFCGYQLDQETGFYQVRYRYLHTTLGRWLSRDPLNNVELMQGANCYAYVSNNPENAVDFSGKIAIGPGGAALSNAVACCKKRGGTYASLASNVYGSMNKCLAECLGLPGVYATSGFAAITAAYIGAKIAQYEAEGYDAEYAAAAAAAVLVAVLSSCEGACAAPGCSLDQKPLLQ